MAFLVSLTASISLSPSDLTQEILMGRHGKQPHKEKKWLKTFSLISRIRNEGGMLPYFSLERDCCRYLSERLSARVFH